MEVTKSNKKKFTSIPYLMPALITIFIFTVLPIIYTVIISFTDYSLYSNGVINFVGFKNFKTLINGSLKAIFVPVLIWNIIFAFATTFGCFIVGLFLAMLLDNPNIKEKGIYKAFLILPWALPGTIATLSWQGLLNTSYGQVNSLLMNLHLISEPIKWLTENNTARMSIIIASVWLGFPYMMNICIGGLAAIPVEYYEAAKVDGASKFTRFIKITLPCLGKVSWPLIISSFAFNFTNFGAAYLITGGNPSRSSTQFAGYTDILASVNYKLVTVSGKYCIASALSILIFIIIATLSYFQLKKSGQFSEVN